MVSGKEGRRDGGRREGRRESGRGGGRMDGGTEGGTAWTDGGSRGNSIYQLVKVAGTNFPRNCLKRKKIISSDVLTVLLFGGRKANISRQNTCQ